MKSRRINPRTRTQAVTEGVTSSSSKTVHQTISSSWCCLARAEAECSSTVCVTRGSNVRFGPHPRLDLMDDPKIPNIGGHVSGSWVGWELNYWIGESVRYVTQPKTLVMSCMTRANTEVHRACAQQTKPDRCVFTGVWGVGGKGEVGVKCRAQIRISCFAKVTLNTELSTCRHAL